MPRAILQKSSLLFVQEFSEPSLIEQADYLLIAACYYTKVVFTLVQEFSEPSVIEQAPYLLIAACDYTKVAFTLCPGVLRAQLD